MTRTKKILIGVVVVAVLGWLAYANLGLKRTSGITVNTEKVERRDLEATVTASGKVQPKRSVDISAETMGKVINVEVEEGDLVTKGQLLLQIDPKNLETAVQNREASLASARSTLDQTRASIENAKIALREAEENLKRQEQMWKNGLLSREVYERAQNDVTRQRTNLLVSEQSAKTQEERIKQEQANLESARYDLNKVRMVSPIAGIVTKRNIDEGETAVVGTMNNAGTVLLTIADLSVIETEIEVDETDIPHIQIGQSAKVTIDAIPDKEFPGKVTEVGNSPITTASTAGRATNFRVKVTIDGLVPNVRPGFTCTAVITTATRTKALSVPIQSMTVREMVVDAAGNVVKPSPTPAAGAPAASPRPMAPAPLREGEKRKEIEGVFLVKDGRVVFTPVKVGIAGDKYFEALSGLQEGDEVVTGPPTAARTLKEGDAVKVTPALGPGASPPAR
jgi:HlyD family secretion protein